MPMYTPDANGSFLPDFVGPLVVQPVIAAAVATQVSTVVNVVDRYHQFRVPIVAEDPSASWVAEGQDIPPDDAVLDEAVAEFRKLAGLTIVSSELADDSSPEAATVVGNGLARDIARKLDGAFFGSVAAPAPPGLGALAGVTTIDAGGPLTNLDYFAAAIAAAEQEGATLTGFVANPADALGLAQLKTADNSNAPLMQPDPTQPTRNQVLGVPFYSSPAVAAGTVWGIPGDRTFVALRKDAELAIDRSRYFESDRVAIRCITRVTFAFAHPKAVIKIDTSVTQTAAQAGATARSPKRS